MPPPGRSAAPPPTRCGATRPTARANVKRGVYRLADEATSAFQQARDAGRGLCRRRGRRRDRVHLGLHAGDQHRRPCAGGAPAARRRDPGLGARAPQQHRALADGGRASGARVRAIPVTEEGRLAYDRLDEVVSGADAGHRRHPCLQRHRCGHRGGAAARRRRRRRTRSCCSTAPSARRTGRSTCRRSAATSTPSPAHKMFGPTGAGVLWGRAELLAELPPLLGGGEMIRRVAIERSTYAAAAAPLRGRHAADRGRDSAWAPPPPGSPRSTGTPCGARRSSSPGASSTASPACPACGCRARPAPRRGSAWSRSRSRASHPHDVCQLLDEVGVCLRGGHHCAQPLMDGFDLPATARASLAPYNDAADVDALIAGLDRAIRGCGGGDA